MDREKDKWKGKEGEYNELRNKTRKLTVMRYNLA